MICSSARGGPGAFGRCRCRVRVIKRDELCAVRCSARQGKARREGRIADERVRRRTFLAE